MRVLSGLAGLVVFATSALCATPLHVPGGNTRAQAEWLLNREGDYARPLRMAVRAPAALGKAKNTLTFDGKIDSIVCPDESKREFTYDGLGNMVSSVFSDWDGKWVAAAKEGLQYTADGQVQRYEMTSWDNELVAEAYVAFSYDARNNISHVVWNLFNEGEAFYTYTHELDDQGLILATTVCEERGCVRDEFSYGADNLMVGSRSYVHWGTDSVYMVATYEMTYDPNGNLLREVQYGDEDAPEDTVFLEEYSWGAQGTLLSVATFYGWSGSLQSASKSQYNYDESAQAGMYAGFFHWEEAQRRAWNPHSRQVTTSIESGNWDPSTGVFNDSAVCTWYYSAFTTVEANRDRHDRQHSGCTVQQQTGLDRALVIDNRGAVAVHAAVYGTDGRLVKSQSMIAGKNTIEMPLVARGRFLLVLSDRSGGVVQTVGLMR